MKHWLPVQLAQETLAVTRRASYGCKQLPSSQIFPSIPATSAKFFYDVSGQQNKSLKQSKHEQIAERACSVEHRIVNPGLLRPHHGQLSLCMIDFG